MGEAPCTVETRQWPGAAFQYLDDTLIGPSIEQFGAGKVGLLAYLGRVISLEPSEEPLSKRFVEPGVGRTCLTDYLRFDRKPEFADFTTLGIGLTPYSRNGYAMVGPYVDGLTSLRRARHRHRCAEHLNRIGCRTARTGAIITLPGLETTMPDETKSPAALMVRGFRTLFRVKQLDPCAGLLLSSQHRPLILTWLMNSDDETLLRAANPDRSEAMALSGTTQSLRSLLGFGTHKEGWIPAMSHNRTILERRRQLITSYAPILLEHAKNSLATELGRDPVRERITDSQYVTWFAQTLGKQLAKMRRARFLHDYHQPGISRYTPSWIYTLCETNVTLLAEFPDLDTAIFLDKNDSETLDELLITSREFSILQNNYQEFHRRDYRESRHVTATLAAIVFHQDRAMERMAIAEFDSAYESQISRARVSISRSAPKPKRRAPVRDENGGEDA